MNKEERRAKNPKNPEWKKETNTERKKNRNLKFLPVPKKSKPLTAEEIRSAFE